MKRQIEIIRTVVAVMLAAGALAAIVWTLVLASPSTSPPELPTLTAPAPGWMPTATSRPDPYPTVSPYPGPYPTQPPRVPGYPVWLPYLSDGESYP